MVRKSWKQEAERMTSLTIRYNQTLADWTVLGTGGGANGAINFLILPRAS